MLEGLEVSVLSLSDIVDGHIDVRIDSDFFEKRFIENSKLLKLKSTESLSIIANISGGNAYSSGAFGYGTRKIATIADVNQNNAIANWNTVAEDEYQRFAENNLESRDILIGGTHHNYWDLGKVFYVNSTGEDLVTFNQRVFCLRVKTNSVISEYLFIALKTKSVRNQIERFGRGNNQLNLSSYDLANIRIPVLSSEFQKNIKAIVDNSYQKLEESKALYKEAETTLLSALGLTDYTPTEENISVKSLSESFGESGRLDSEFYQPKYDELFKCLNDKEDITTLNLITTQVQRGKQPEYCDEGYPVVNSKHVRTGKVILDDNRIGAIIPGQIVIETGDLLMNGTGVGTIGRVAPYLHEEKALPDNHVTVIKALGIDPVYLSIYLNSIAGQLQVEKYTKGSSGQVELYPDEIKQFLIWKAPKGVQEKVRDCVETSFRLENESKQLLDLAKRSVEVAIEEGERSGMSLLKRK